MKILAFNTSGKYCSVALEHDGEIDYRAANLPSKQAETLLPFSQELLEAKNIDWKEIDYLAVNTGPGSFTGIRIAVAAAQGVLLAQQSIKAAALTAFEANASKAFSAFDGKFSYCLVVINALRGGLYVACLDRSLREIKEASLIELEQFGYYLSELINNEVGVNEFIITGSGLQLEEVYNSASFKNCYIYGGSENTADIQEIDARDAARAAKIKLANNESFRQLTPLYIRKPDVGKVK
jgi:tRNA threonylcarbamoyladenosine biosynthesis protein TsaB